MAEKCKHNNITIYGGCDFCEDCQEYISSEDTAGESNKKNIQVTIKSSDKKEDGQLLIAIQSNGSIFLEISYDDGFQSEAIEVNRDELDKALSKLQ